MPITRRDFIKKGSIAIFGLSMAGTITSLLWKDLTSFALNSGENILVVLQLTGGNDGLNTIIPYGKGAYYDNRKVLAIKQKDVLPIDHEIGFHPSMKGFKSLYDRQKLAVINGVGYPNPNHSHFRSMEIWQTADPVHTDAQSGWLGRYLETVQDKNNPLLGISIGSSMKTFLSHKVSVPAIDNINSFRLRMTTNQQEFERQLTSVKKMYSNSSYAKTEMVRQLSLAAFQSSDSLQKKLKGSASLTEKPKNVNSLERDLELIADCIQSGIGSKTYFAKLGGFDEHHEEKDHHAKLLGTLDQAVTSFYNRLENEGNANRVALLMYSEFGRRVKENGSGGTDHGTAGPVFVLGGKVKGGLYGAYPSLTDLDHGDFKYNVDFRSVYATLLEQWLNAPAKDILHGSFENLSLL